MAKARLPQEFSDPNNTEPKKLIEFEDEFSFWDEPFSGAMLVLGNATPSKHQKLLRN